MDQIDHNYNITDETYVTCTINNTLMGMLIKKPVYQACVISVNLKASQLYKHCIATDVKKSAINI